MASSLQGVDRSHELREILLPAMIFPTVAVGLRLWSRLVIRGDGPVLWWDDWLTLMALPISLAVSAITYYWTFIGAGRSIHEVSKENVTTGLQIMFADFFLWNIGISLSKISVLFFYARVFKVSKRFNIALWITGAIAMAWALFAFFSSLFQCTPVERAWQPLMEGTCIAYYPWFNSLAISGLVVDVLILCLPIPILYRMHLTLTRKLLVLAVFICGYSLITFSIGRVITTRDLNINFIEDPTITMVTFGRWLLLENPYCIAATCLPLHYSLVKRGFTHGFKALFTKQYIPSKSSGFSFKQRRSTFGSLNSNASTETFLKPIWTKGDAYSNGSVESLALVTPTPTRSTFSRDEYMHSPIAIPQRSYGTPPGNWI